jgi:hypothetical protein
LPRKDDGRPNSGHLSQARRGGLGDELDLSITEIAVMWILHHGSLPRRPQRSLTRDIVEFYPAALATILRAEALRGAKQSALRLIYFKGLIVALTHPRPEMIDAIRRADLALERGATSAGRSDPAVRRSAAIQPSEDQDTLAHIADALERSSGSAH